METGPTFALFCGPGCISPVLGLRPEGHEGADAMGSHRLRGALVLACLVLWPPGLRAGLLTRAAAPGVSRGPTCAPPRQAGWGREVLGKGCALVTNHRPHPGKRGGGQLRLPP